MPEITWRAESRLYNVSPTFMRNFGKAGIETWIKEMYVNAAPPELREYLLKDRLFIAWWVSTGAQDANPFGIAAPWSGQEVPHDAVHFAGICRPITETAIVYVEAPQ